MKITFARQELLLISDGALYWPARNTLIVSDLHLEKGSYLASHGSMLPGYDTEDVLQRLQQLIELYKPDQVICLGDNLHDAKALSRISEINYEKLYDICASVNTWIWIIGNHDKGLLDNKLFTHFMTVKEWFADPLIFCHDVTENIAPQIIGHFHPKAKVKKNNIIINGKCFMVSQKLLIMPSFGTYTGGLDIHADVLKEVFLNDPYNCYLLHNKKIWKII